MKLAFNIGLGCLAFVIGSSFAQGQGTFHFRAVLDGGQVNPPFGVEGDPIVSPFTGTVSMQLVQGGTGDPRLTYSIQLPGMDLDGSVTPGDFSDDVTAIHIHNAGAGANGQHVLNVYGFSAGEIREDDADMTTNPSLAAVTGAWDDSDQLFTGPGGTRQAFDSIALTGMVDELNAGNLYFQIHTLNFPNGELRGQITAVPEPRSAVLIVIGVAIFGLVARHSRWR